MSTFSVYIIKGDNKEGIMNLVSYDCTSDRRLEAEFKDAFLKGWDERTRARRLKIGEVRWKKPFLGIAMKDVRG